MTRFRFIRRAGRVRLAFLLPLAVIATLLATTGPAAAQTTDQGADQRAAGQGRGYEAFYVFGDSLADTGNALIATTQIGLMPAIPPSASPNLAYYHGRFSNGPVFAEYLWALLSRRGGPSSIESSIGGSSSASSIGSSIGLTPSLALTSVPAQGGVSFAFGGAGTSDVDVTPGGFLVPGLKGQVEMFRAGLAGMTPSPRALYVIVSGANDYLRPTPLDPAQSVSNIADAIRALYDLGARNVIVLNLPDLGALPLVAGLPQSALLSALTMQHNQMLAASLRELEASSPDLRLIGIDVATALNRVPGVSNTTLPAMDALLPAQPGEPPASVCLFIDPATCRDVPTFDVGFRYFYWDAEHPTTAIHAMMALHIFTAVMRANDD